MFRAIISVQIFKKIIEALKDLCKETNVNIDENGMTIKAMDSSHVCLFHLQLKDCFSEFSIERGVAIAFNLDNLSKILRICDNDATIVLSLPTNSKLNIESQSNDRVLKFDMNLLDLEMESMEVPDMEFVNTIVMQSSEYTRMCRDMSQFSDTLKITVKGDCIEFSIEGDCGDGSLTLHSSDKMQFTLQTCLEFYLSLKYLLLFSKATPICETLKIEMGENLPIKLTFEITNNDYLTFYLAPKID